MVVSPLVSWSKMSRLRNKRRKGINGQKIQTRKEIIQKLVGTLPLAKPPVLTVPPPSTPTFPIVMFYGQLTSVPPASPLSVTLNTPDTINAIPTVPSRVPALEPSIDNSEPKCAQITFRIEPRKKADCIHGVSDEMLRQVQKRVAKAGLDAIDSPLLAAMVSCLYVRNGNLKTYHSQAKKCESELLRRFRAGPIFTPLGVIKSTRGNVTHNMWSVLHCFARCAQCKRHTSLSSPLQANNGNIRVVEFYTRKCGCALRYCPSCVENYYIDPCNRSVKNVICWMCKDNQEHGFKRWSVKVPYQTVCHVNEETSQHACCLFEPCHECKHNTRPTESYLEPETLELLKQLNSYLGLARNCLRPIVDRQEGHCALCNQETTAGDNWSFEGCECSQQPFYHIECAKIVATHFETTCPFCAHKGFFKL